MKSPAITNRKYFFNYNHYKLCGKLKLFAGRLLSLWLESLHTGTSTLVRQGLLIGRPVVQTALQAVMAHLSNGWYLVGDIFLGLGAVAFFFHQFFSEPITVDANWYYQNWFYFFYTLRPFECLVLGSLAVWCYWPSKSNTVYIVMGVLQSLGWLGIFHYSFFVYDYKTFHMIPFWDVWVMAGSWAVGVMLSAHYVVHRYNHWIRGNHMRFVGVGEMDVPVELKGKLVETLAKEYRELEQRA
jgi:hypothetical protein